MNYLKILIPVVAVLVIGESIILLSGITKKEEVANTKVGNIPTVSTEEATPSSVVTDPDFNLVFGYSGGSQMKVSQPSVVEVNLLGKNTRAVDSLNLYVKYDPKSFDIDNLTFDPKLPKPTFSKVSTAKGMVVVNFLISEAAGMEIAEGDSLTLVRFDAVPKTVGDFSFEISTGNGTNESATMFVENATAKVLPYSGSKLTVKVIK